MTQLELCEKIAREAHEGQFRRDKEGKMTVPYIKHVEAVVSRCETDEEKCVAWLHDVIEDCDPIFAIRIWDKLGDGIYRHVLLLTSDGLKDYQDFIEDITYCHICTKVKIADILSNLAGSPTDKQIVKYAKALLVLVK